MGPTITVGGDERAGSERNTGGPHHISSMVGRLLGFVGGSIGLHKGVKPVWLPPLRDHLRSGCPPYQFSKTQYEYSGLVRN